MRESLNDYGMEVDASTMFWIQMSDFLARFWPILLAVAIAIGVGLYLWSRSSSAANSPSHRIQPTDEATDSKST